ncbi:GNAT family N-acetyltransferase [Streptomyces marincola]|uniref:GNAT family N-acetyltransferase n=1 Tax=Streptomyces marincola TaxID=2878388 RepID=UPI001CF20B3F|nr:GNAT family N-acetyltransferase [Streptomyces marincola]UCM90252.1 GNAT family N-acetyltransferase [Streptomyces marincola]
MRNGRRPRALDPLLPRALPLPPPAPGDTPLHVPGAEGVHRRTRPDLDTFDATWSAAERHELYARPTGPDRAGALDALLTAWRERLPGWPPPGDAEAVFTWPSRDTELTPVLLAHGMGPRRVAAVRPAGRPVPGPRRGPGTSVRPLGPGDVDAAAALWLDGLRWDARFGACVIRRSSARNVRALLARALGWVAEDSGTVVGVVAVEDPGRTAWAARLATARHPGYLTALAVDRARRGAGIGTALVRTAHAALEEAGCTLTVLHYAALSPLSGPFWHRCGYRPLWTTWAATGSRVQVSAARASDPPGSRTRPAGRPG